jgi:hypothetical protein
VIQNIHPFKKTTHTTETDMTTTETDMTTTETDMTTTETDMTTTETDMTTAETEMTTTETEMTTTETEMTTTETDMISEHLTLWDSRNYRLFDKLDGLILMYLKKKYTELNSPQLIDDEDIKQFMKLTADNVVQWRTIEDYDDYNYNMDPVITDDNKNNFDFWYFIPNLEDVIINRFTVNMVLKLKDIVGRWAGKYKSKHSSTYYTFNKPGTRKINKNNVIGLYEYYPNTLKAIVRLYVHYFVNRNIDVWKSYVKDADANIIYYNNIYKLESILTTNIGMRDNIQILNITYHSLKTIPDTLPPSLIELSVNNNLLTALPNNLPDGIKIINCYSNKLTALPDKLPASLQILKCAHNEIAVIPENLPDCLVELHVSSNKLTALPAHFPPRLNRLECSYNKIATLTSGLLTSKVEILNIQQNKLVDLLTELLPPTLKTINCSYNYPSYISDNIPPTLEKFICYNNCDNDKLRRLPHFPLTITELKLSIESDLYNWSVLHYDDINVLDKVKYINNVNDGKLFGEEKKKAEQQLLKQSSERSYNAMKREEWLNEGHMIKY